MEPMVSKFFRVFLSLFVVLNTLSPMVNAQSSITPEILAQQITQTVATDSETTEPGTATASASESRGDVQSDTVTDTEDTNIGDLQEDAGDIKENEGDSKEDDIKSNEAIPPVEDGIVCMDPDPNDGLEVTGVGVEFFDEGTGLNSPAYGLPQGRAHVSCEGSAGITAYQLIVTTPSGDVQRYGSITEGDHHYNTSMFDIPAAESGTYSFMCKAWVVGDQKPACTVEADLEGFCADVVTLDVPYETIPVVLDENFKELGATTRDPAFELTWTTIRATTVSSEVQLYEGNDNTGTLVRTFTFDNTEGYDCVSDRTYATCTIQDFIQYLEYGKNYYVEINVEGQYGFCNDTIGFPITFTPPCQGEECDETPVCDENFEVTGQFQTLSDGVVLDIHDSQPSQAPIVTTETVAVSGSLDIDLSLGDYRIEIVVANYANGIGGGITTETPVYEMLTSTEFAYEIPLSSGLNQIFVNIELLNSNSSLDSCFDLVYSHYVRYTPSTEVTCEDTIVGAPVITQDGASVGISCEGTASQYEAIITLPDASTGVVLVGSGETVSYTVTQEGDYTVQCFALENDESVACEEETFTYTPGNEEELVECTDISVAPTTFVEGSDEDITITCTGTGDVSGWDVVVSNGTTLFNPSQGDNVFTYNVANLTAGDYTFECVAENDTSTNGNAVCVETVTITTAECTDDIDLFTITQPNDGITTSNESITVAGEVDADAVDYVFYMVKENDENGAIVFSGTLPVDSTTNTYEGTVPLITSDTSSVVNYIWIGAYPIDQACDPQINDIYVTYNALCEFPIGTVSVSSSDTGSVSDDLLTDITVTTSNTHRKRVRVRITNNGVLIDSATRVVFGITTTVFADMDLAVGTNTVSVDVISLDGNGEVALNCLEKNETIQIKAIELQICEDPISFLTIDSPANGSTITNQNSVPVVGTVDGAATQHVTWVVTSASNQAGVTIATGTGVVVGDTYSFDAPLQPNASHIITVTAHPSDEMCAPRERHIRLRQRVTEEVCEDPISPFTISTPVDGTTTTGSSVTVTGTVETGATSQVIWMLKENNENGDIVDTGIATVNADGTYSFEVDLVVGATNYIWVQAQGNDPLCSRINDVTVIQTGIPVCEENEVYARVGFFITEGDALFIVENGMVVDQADVSFNLQALPTFPSATPNGYQFTVTHNGATIVNTSDEGSLIQSVILQPGVNTFTFDVVRYGSNICAVEVITYTIIYQPPNTGGQCEHPVGNVTIVTPTNGQEFVGDVADLVVTTTSTERKLVVVEVKDAQGNEIDTDSVWTSDDEITFTDLTYVSGENTISVKVFAADGLFSVDEDCLIKSSAVTIKVEIVTECVDTVVTPETITTQVNDGFVVECVGEDAVKYMVTGKRPDGSEITLVDDDPTTTVFPFVEDLMEGTYTFQCLAWSTDLATDPIACPAQSVVVDYSTQICEDEDKVRNLTVTQPLLNNGATVVFNRDVVLEGTVEGDVTDISVYVVGQDFIPFAEIALGTDGVTDWKFELIVPTPNAFNSHLFDEAGFITVEVRASSSNQLCGSDIETFKIKYFPPTGGSCPVADQVNTNDLTLNVATVLGNPNALIEGSYLLDGPVGSVTYSGYTFSGSDLTIVDNTVSFTVPVTLSEGDNVFTFTANPKSQDPDCRPVNTSVTIPYTVAVCEDEDAVGPITFEGLPTGNFYTGTSYQFTGTITNTGEFVALTLNGEFIDVASDGTFVVSGTFTTPGTEIFVFGVTATTQACGYLQNLELTYDPNGGNVCQDPIGLMIDASSTSVSNSTSQYVFHGAVGTDGLVGVEVQVQDTVELITVNSDGTFTYTGVINLGSNTFTFVAISDTPICNATETITITRRSNGGGGGGGGRSSSILCGNDRIDDTSRYTEQCDDGNTRSGDGCSSTCQIEEEPVCGNGIIEVGEMCDDNNTISGDGCSSTCDIEDSTIKKELIKKQLRPSPLGYRPPTPPRELPKTGSDVKFNAFRGIVN